MRWNIKDAPLQKRKVAVVTGANVGLGYEVALGLSRKGAQVIMACRNLQKAQQAQTQILKACPYADISYMELDLSKISSVKSFAAEFKEQYTQLDLLVNNAGIMMTPYTLTEDGFELQLATNYIGHFALTALLFPLLKATAEARVVTVGSLAHRWTGINFDDLHSTQKYNKVKAYGQSKLACLMFAYELDRRLSKAGIDTISVAAHPGTTGTNIASHMPDIFVRLFHSFGQKTKEGALPVLYAAMGDDIRGGDYCGPDGWGEMWGAPVKVASSGASHSKEDAARLWQKTEEMTGICFEI